MRLPPTMPRVPEVLSLLEGADHVDVKVVTGTVSMRAFIAEMFGYQPAWMTGLYRVRGVFVRFLGLRQARPPRAPRLSSTTVPMQPGERVSFFTVRLAQDEFYWVAEADDSHLKAALGVVVEPLQNGRRHFYVLTVVHYHTWAGPVYFNVIRPFHHLVVGRMAAAGVHAPT
jgi:hypothetical protein